jgi:hypothetical protein
MRRLNGWLTIFWLIMIPISLLAGWLNRVVFVSALSSWALVSDHWSTWQTARVEVNQDQEARRQHHRDVPAEVVDEIVARTNVQDAHT